MTFFFGFVCIYKCVLAFIWLRFLINNCKNAFCTGKGIQNTCCLLAHHRNWLAEGTCILKEGCDGTNVEHACKPVKRHHTTVPHNHYGGTGNSNYGILHVGTVVHKRAHKSTKGHCGSSCFTKIICKYIKFLFCMSFVIKYLDYLLTFNHFFYKSVHSSYALLILTESICRTFTNSYHKQGNKNHCNNHYEGEHWTEHKHHNKYRNYSDCR